MKYETISETKTGSYNENDTVTFTFTYSNNIDHIESFSSLQPDAKIMRLTSCSFTNNVLTAVFTCYRTLISGPYTGIVNLTVTVASY